MTIVEFLSHLRGLDVRLWVDDDGDRLRCSTPNGVLTPALRTELAERKGDCSILNHNLTAGRPAQLA